MLRVHRSERADALVRALAAVLREPPTDPFAAEVVAVPSRGVERWISQSLAAVLGVGPSGDDGVAANLRFPSPARLVADAVACASGVDPDEDPWSERRLTWSVLAAVDELVESPAPAFTTLARHLRTPGRRVAVAHKVAGLFTSYAAQRPDLLRAWTTGADGDVEPDLRWQPEVFRHVRERVGIPSPAERLDSALAALATQPGLVDLPERFSMFGPTRLTTSQLRVVDVLASERDVHLWLPHPSPVLWRRVEELGDGATGLPTRRKDPTAALPRHPLLASLGRDSRELQLMLRAHTQGDALHHPVPAPPGETRETLLRRLQRGIRDDEVPGGDFVLDPADRSVQVHACHGRQRQVEVMREVLLGVLADDPSLELRDVIVMCPDIEAFAPLISASFGLARDPDADDQATAPHPAHRLRVRLADRSLRQTNPVLGVAARLLDLADSRVSASELLDLAAMPPVRRRFGLDDEALERVREWVRISGVRWGLDASARTPYFLQGVAQNTWQAGLDRLLVGVAMDEEGQRSVGLALPLDDVSSQDVDLAGRIAELVERTAAAVARLSDAQPMTGWLAALGTCLDELVDVAPEDAWQLTSARRELAEAAGSPAAAEEGARSGGTGQGVSVTLADVRALVAGRLRGRPTRANFRTGHLTMCSMVPMRAVPHRVVVLLGLDDQAFPRHPQVDGDDVLVRSPRVGERDARGEDRQLLLDALLAAQDTVVVLYSGRDERTGAERPPAVPLGELLDVLDRTATSAVQAKIVAHHPLQPFDPRNFTEHPAGLPATTPFSFDAAALDGARALLAEREPPQAFVPHPLPPPPFPSTAPGVVALDDLLRFLEHPVRAFRRRLGLPAAVERQQPGDALPVELDGLERWAVGDRLLEARLAGVELGPALRAERLRGTIPPGPLGQVVLDPIADSVEAVVQASAAYRIGTPVQLDVAVELAGGLAVVGTVPDVYGDPGDSVVRVTYSVLGPKHRLRAWALALTLAASDPDRRWRAVTVGRHWRDQAAVSTLGGVAAADARRELDRLVALYLLGMREPLPLPTEAAAAYATARFKRQSPEAAARAAASKWRRRPGGARAEIGEYDDADHRLVWGDVPFEHLLRQPPDPAESTDAWEEPEPHRFGALAGRLWAPLLRVER